MVESFNHCPNDATCTDAQNDFDVLLPFTAKLTNPILFGHTRPRVKRFYPPIFGTAVGIFNRYYLREQISLTGG